MKLIITQIGKNFYNLHFLDVKWVIVYNISLLSQKVSRVCFSAFKMSNYLLLKYVLPIDVGTSQIFPPHSG